MRIAHITAHMGGGVGSVLKSFFKLSYDYGVYNELYCLDRCNSNFAELDSLHFKRDGLAYGIANTVFNKTVFDKYDVILVHYWNHPLMTKFLIETDFPQSKLAIWTHNSGLFEPQIIPEYLVFKSSKIIFSSECSLAAQNLASAMHISPTMFGVVHSTRSLNEFLSIGKSRYIKQNLHNLVYVGTVSDSKMHPDSAMIFSELSKLGFNIRVVGGPNHLELLNRVIDFGGIIDTFGEVMDVNDHYEWADIFIYPLKEEHYGTGEQVLLEAMATGLPVVCFNNPAEASILKGAGGILASSAKEFIDHVVNISTDRTLCKSMSLKSINTICSKYDSKLMCINLLEQFSEMQPRDFCSININILDKKNYTDLDLYVTHSFLDANEILKKIMQDKSNPIDIVLNKIDSIVDRNGDFAHWFSDSKSTPFHYLKYFPFSHYLRELCAKLHNRY